MSLDVLTLGSGPPLLALHGFSGTARTWSYQLDAWATRYRVVAPDLLGHGGSDAPDDPASYALERQADDLVTLLALFEATPATVVGYSMGARLALVLALRHQALVDRLVLESPSAGISDVAERAARRREDEALAEYLERDGVEAFVTDWETRPIFASQTALPDDVRAEQHRQRLRHTAIGLAGSLRGAGQGAMAPLHDRLGEIHLPTLVVAGALDDVGLARARTVAEAVPDARLEIITGAGHSPHLERPTAFIDICDDFLLTARPDHAR